MDTAQPNVPVEQVSPTLNKNLNLLLFIIVGIIMLLVGLSGGYLLFANKSQIKEVTTQISPTGIQQTSPNSNLSTTGIPLDTQKDSMTTDASGWLTYTDSEIGISFQYPTSWGKAIRDEEPCDINNQSVKEYNNQPCVSIRLVSPSINGIFFGTQSQPFFPPSRGGSVFDGINNIDLNSYCEKLSNSSSCKLLYNSNGVSYIKSLEHSVTVIDLGTSYMYYVSNQNKIFPITLLTGYRFLDSMSQKEIETTFDKILSTFRYTK